MRVLVVEDERKIADFIKRGLKEEGYAVDVSADGEAGYFLSGTNDYDVIILDIMLPKMDGVTLLKKIRLDRNPVPVIMLTAKDDIQDKVTGLDSGADDYLTKPFIFAELLARIRAVLRKKETSALPKLKVEDLEMDLVTHTVMRAGKEVILTTKEFALLEYLLRRAGTVITRSMISEHVWDISFSTDTNVIDVYINYLRKKVDQGHKKRLIHTIRGRGYTLKG